MARKAKKTIGKNMTQISISLPTELIKAIDEMAAADNRNRSNFIAKTMKDLVDAAAAQHTEEL